MNAPAKIRTVPIDAAMLGKADALGIDVVRACEAGLDAAIRRAADPRSTEEKRAADQRWAEENRVAMEAWNHWVDRNGMPLPSTALSDGVSGRASRTADGQALPGRTG